MQCRNLCSPRRTRKVLRISVPHVDSEPFYPLSFTSQNTPLSTFFLIYHYITRKMAAPSLLAKIFLAVAPEYTLTRSAEIYSIRSLFTATTIGKVS